LLLINPTQQASKKGVAGQIIHPLLKVTALTSPLWIGGRPGDRLGQLTGFRMEED
jgi:hypothetical protein